MLCDYLLTIAEQGCFTPYWSVEVLDAMERSVVQRHRALPEQIHRRRLFMEEAFPGAMVNGYQHLVGIMTNHPGDRHVLAACVVSPAQTLVTFNLRDFPRSSLEPYDIEAVHPDDFLLDQFDLHPIWTRQATKQMLLRYANPPQEISELAKALEPLVPKAANVVQALSD